jgi:CspA family cold shock protein
MNLTLKLIISLVIAAAVATATTFVQGKPMPDVPMLIACSVTALISAIIASISAAGQAGPRQAGPRQAGPRQAGPRQAGSDQEGGRSAGSERAAKSPAAVPGKDATREFGEVKWFNASKGFGFIIKDDGDEIFVHFRSIRGEGRRGLRDGQRVSFVVVDSQKGPQAEDVAAES